MFDAVRSIAGTPTVTLRFQGETINDIASVRRDVLAFANTLMQASGGGAFNPNPGSVNILNSEGVDIYEGEDVYTPIVNILFGKNTAGGNTEMRVDTDVTGTFCATITITNCKVNNPINSGGKNKFYFVPGNI